MFEGFPQCPHWSPEICFSFLSTKIMPSEITINWSKKWLIYSFNTGALCGFTLKWVLSKMGGFSIGYINNLYIGGKRNGAKLNLYLVNKQHSHQRGVAGIDHFLWFGQYSWFCFFYVWGGTIAHSLYSCSRRPLGPDHILYLGNSASWNFSSHTAT